MGLDCRRGRACAGRDRNDRPAQADTGLCVPCERRLATVLAELPTLYVELWQNLPAGGSGGERVSGSKSAPLPLRVDVEALMADTVNVVLQLERKVRAAAHLSPRHGRGLRSGPNLTTAVTVLGAHLSVLLALPERAELAVDRNRMTVTRRHDTDQLFGLHRGIRQTLGLTKLTHRLPAPCWNCEVKAVVRDDGSDTVTCEACHRRWTIKEYETMTTAWAHLLKEEMA